MKMKFWQLCPQDAVREEGVLEDLTLVLKKGEIIVASTVIGIDQKIRI
jgi:hypothetical protein